MSQMLVTNTIDLNCLSNEDMQELSACIVLLAQIPLQQNFIYTVAAGYSKQCRWVS